MAKRRAQFISAITVILWGWSLLGAPAVTPARETSIARLLIPFFKIRVKDPEIEKLWNTRNSEIQEALLKALAEKNIEGILSIKALDLDLAPETFTSEGSSNRVDALIVGEFHDSEFIFEIASALTGRILDKITIAISDPIHQSPKDLADSIINAFLEKLKYVGFVTAIHKDEAKINAGKQSGLKAGDLLVLFDFDGERPTFSSHLHRIGVFKLLKVANNASLGSFTTLNKTPLSLYTKVAVPRPRPVKSDLIKPPLKIEDPVKEEKNSSDDLKGWVFLGGSGYSLSTQVPANAATLQLRNVQVPMSPAATFGVGYSRFSFEGLFSSASNSSNTLNAVEGAAHFKILLSGFLFTSIGVFYSQENVTPSANPTTLLISSTTYSPEIQEGLRWNLKSSYIYGVIDIFYPLFSSDGPNGNSTISSSFAGGLELGWRFEFSQKWAGELGLQGRYSSIQTQNGEITQRQYSLGPRLYYSF